MTICLDVEDVSGLSNPPQGGARTSRRQGDGDACNSVCPSFFPERPRSQVYNFPRARRVQGTVVSVEAHGVLCVFPATLGNAVLLQEAIEGGGLQSQTCRLSHVKWLCLTTE